MMLNLYWEPGVTTKLLRLKLPSEVLTSLATVMGVMSVWSTRTRLKVDGSDETEVHWTSTVLEKSSCSSLVGEVTMMAGSCCQRVLVWNPVVRKLEPTLDRGHQAGKREDRLGEHSVDG